MKHIQMVWNHECSQQFLFSIRFQMNMVSLKQSINLIAFVQNYINVNEHPGNNNIIVYCHNEPVDFDGWE